MNARVARKVSATALRGNLRSSLKAAKGAKVVLIENRRQPAKYLVDKIYFDELMRERASIAATLEILADQELAARLILLAKTIDRDVKKNRLLTMEKVCSR
jgi:PHD/YefM family antitoxin component YafN of YafNO toxin-antitoxin module